MVVWTLIVAWAADPFPDARLDRAQVEAVWTPEVIGAPARIYDETTASARVDRDRRILAMVKGVDVAELRVSAALQRYARLVLAVRRIGVPDRVYDWFAAEHVGLAKAPWLRGTFASATEEGAAELVARLTSDVGDDATIAVATEPIDGGIVGVVVQTDDTVAFAPFPRIVQPGETLRIPGAVLDSRIAYALWVENTGTRVDRYPLEGEGEFDVELAVPSEPGAYRIAMGAYEKNRLPDQPFFFTTYVGVEPPAEPDLPDLGTPETSLAEYEARLLAEVNAERVRCDLPPLQRSGDATLLRGALDEMPDKERAIVRYLDRFVAQDPLPTIPHGEWRVIFGNGFGGAASTAYAWIEHPIWRDRLLDARFDRIALGARTLPDGTYSTIGVLVAPADDASLRDEAARQLAARWPDEAGPKPAPALEAELEALAADSASGKVKSKKVGKAMDKVFGKGLITGGATSWTSVVPPGSELDTSSMRIEPGAEQLAIGYASGDLGRGDGFTYSVIVAVAAKGAK